MGGTAGFYVHKQPVPRRRFRGTGVFLFFERSKQHEGHPLQDLPHRGGNAPVLVQCSGRYEDEARAAAEPRHSVSHDPGGAGAGVLPGAGSSGAGRPDTLYRNPPGGPEFLPDVPSLPAGSGLLSGGKAPDSGKDLLQVRGQQHLRLPQAQFRHRPGLLRQKAGSARRHHGDGSRPVGHGPEHGLRLPGA